MSDFEREVLEHLAELRAGQAETKAEVKAIVARLDRLNGSVARHQEAIAALQLDKARREGEEASSNTWLDRLWPFIYAAARIAGFLVLTHAEDVLKLFS